MSDTPTPETDAVAAIEGSWDTKAIRMTYRARALERELNAARAELAELRRDKARLDHLAGLTNTKWVLNGKIYESYDLREAIDAAMQEGGQS